MSMEFMEQLTTPNARRIPVEQVPAEVLRLPILDIARRGEGKIHIKLSGALPDQWLLRLAQGCAARKIGLMNGSATRVEPGHWRAEVELDVAMCAGRIPDFLDLATQDRAAPGLAEPGALEVAVSGVDSGAGEVEVEVHAWDEVGLLAAVLGRADRCGFSPVEIVLETEEDCAFHRVVLEARGGRRATRRQKRALVSDLIALLP